MLKFEEQLKRCDIKAVAVETVQLVFTQTYILRRTGLLSFHSHLRSLHEQSTPHTGCGQRG